MAKKLRATSTPEIEDQVEEKPTKRGRKAKSEPAPVQATEQQKREAMERLIDAHKAMELAKAEHDKKRSSYRAIFKETKRITGFTDDALSWYMKSRKAEPHELDAEIRERARIAKFMGLPVGFQAAFDFDASEPVETTDDDEGALQAANAQGFEAGMSSDKPEANPYPAGTKRAEQWQRGYESGMKQIAARMGGKTVSLVEAHA